MVRGHQELKVCIKTSFDCNLSAGSKPQYWRITRVLSFLCRLVRITVRLILNTRGLNAAFNLTDTEKVHQKEKI